MTEEMVLGICAILFWLGLFTSIATVKIYRIKAENKCKCKRKEGK